MSSEINIRRLLYYKSEDSGTFTSNLVNDQQSQRAITTLRHKLNRFRTTGQSEFNLLTLHTQTPRQNFRYGIDVEAQQNPNSQTHYLEAYDMRHIHSYINESRRYVAQLKDQANRIRLELNAMESQHQNDLTRLQAQFTEAIQLKRRFLKEDQVSFLDHQYRMNKEYIKLIKSKVMMEEQQQQLQSRVTELERTLQGVTQQ